MKKHSTFHKGEIKAITLKAARDAVKMHGTQNKQVYIPIYDSDSDLSEALNTVYSCFDIDDFSDELKKLTVEQALVHCIFNYSGRHKVST